MLYWFNCFNVIFLVQPGESSQKGPVRRVQSGRCMGGPARNVQPRRTSRKGPVMRVQPGRSRGVQPGRSNPKSSANSVQPRDLDPEWDPQAGSSKCPEWPHKHPEWDSLFPFGLSLLLVLLEFEVQLVL